MQLSEALIRRNDTSVHVLAVSVDSPESSAVLLRNLDRRGYHFSNTQLLHDEAHRVIDHYGLLDYSLWATVPYPATYIIDVSGRVRWRFVEKDFRIRASAEEILCQLDHILGITAPCDPRPFYPGFDSLPGNR